MVIVGKLSNKQSAAINYFADYLISRQMQRFITLHFVFRYNLDCLGITSINDYNDRNQPRDFVIEINRNQSEIELLKTLAHELVHVKQYIYNELNDDQSLWLGKRYNPDKIPYDQQPWEVEAESLAFVLFEEFTSSNGD